MAAIVTVLALASCGGGESSSTETVAAKAPTPKVIEVHGPGKNPDGGCQAQMDEFLGRMNDLRQSLLAGLSYAEYVVRVGAIRDAYEAVPVKKLGVDCLDGPASDAEDAFNQYLRAANTWGDCAGTAGCAASEIEGKLQHRWHLASKSLDQAEKD